MDLRNRSMLAALKHELESTPEGQKAKRQEAAKKAAETRRRNKMARDHKYALIRKARQEREARLAPKPELVAKHEAARAARRMFVPCVVCGTNFAARIDGTLCTTCSNI